MSEDAQTQEQAQKQAQEQAQEQEQEQAQDTQEQSASAFDAWARSEEGKSLCIASKHGGGVSVIKLVSCGDASANRCMASACCAQIVHAYGLQVGSARAEVDDASTGTGTSKKRPRVGGDGKWQYKIEWQSSKSKSSTKWCDHAIATLGLDPVVCGCCARSDADEELVVCARCRESHGLEIVDEAAFAACEQGLKRKRKEARSASAAKKKSPRPPAASPTRTPDAGAGAAEAAEAEAAEAGREPVDHRTLDHRTLDTMVALSRRLQDHLRAAVRAAGDQQSPRQGVQSPRQGK
jgi:hypothetical protein